MAFLTAYFTSSASAFSAPGNYTMTASYSGDGNYAPVTSSGTQITVQYPNPSVTLTPVSQNVNAGGMADRKCAGGHNEQESLSDWNHQL